MSAGTSEYDPSYAEARVHFNEPVVDMFSVVRLIGWGQDEDDCYYIYLRHGAGQVYRSSAVGGFIALTPLKQAQSPDGLRHALEDPACDDFDQLDKWLALNGAPRADVFRLEDRSIMSTRVTPAKEMIDANQSLPPAPDLRAYDAAAPR